MKVNSRPAVVCADWLAAESNLVHCNAMVTQSLTWLPDHPQKGAESKKSELLVLDSKRSNAINIGMTVLPAVHVIKTAILNFDEFAISKEGIEVGVSIRRSEGFFFFAMERS